MASMIPLQTIIPSITKIPFAGTNGNGNGSVAFSTGGRIHHEKKIKNKIGSSVVVSAVGDLAADSTTYLVAGAIAVALVGTAFPIVFSRKDTCPECDGAGFVRKAGATLRANAARKDQAQIVCARCNGLGKLNQIDK
ncbi:hypothetical protein HN51_005111 [Arachis hypogaea]|uniref:Uncharacterized protein n=2 Tax=Arachis TaxID=3817 RepID=A0A445DG02_ARAHY|nr:uncharacterized protein LOC107484781 [Arachis duranensis]XP_025695405.1 uncharacterized protein LOC112796938 [Arachis hypogaea]QHO38810.1 uncharacterized protein DS421_4g123650 [Arachis hypogaea]RYR62127.1 hypothetical protein Ahy_A04g019488 [Arachis hypogaea]